jgi:hypothetical protein
MCGRSVRTGRGGKVMKEPSLLSTRAFVANDIAFITEAVRVERLRHRLAMSPDARPEERIEYLRRRALLLTVVAERTGDRADRSLAEKAWESVRAAKHTEGASEDAAESTAEHPAGGAAEDDTPRTPPSPSAGR